MSFPETPSEKPLSFPLNWYLKIDNLADLRLSLNVAQDIGFSALITSVVHPDYKREFIDEQVANNQTAFTRTPIVLNAEEWLHRVSPYLDPPNVGVKDEELRANNEIQFLQELCFAFHLKPQEFIYLKLANNDPEALGAALLNGFTCSLRFDGKILVEVPMTSNASLVSAQLSDINISIEDEDQWKVWNKFHAATGYSNKVQVAVFLTSDLPSDEELNRWLGEHIGMIVIPHTTFMINSSKLPELPKRHARVVAMFLQFSKGCKIAIEPKELGDRLSRQYAEFVDNVIKTSVDNTLDTSLDDCLRHPLQPLHEHLDTGTYEIFETDPAKYILYQRAIEAAMIDKISDVEKDTKRLVLVILGAGRGPLVRAAINACKNTGRRLKVLVVEKNPNAIVTLINLISVLWPNEDITMISKDMRKLNLDEKADIIVSELLGSFGDNELSPECLDGAQHLLKDDGISIPYNSTSYLRPVMTTRVMNRLMEEDTKREKKNPDSPLRPSKEMNWQVKFSSVYYIDKPKPVFKFVHPNHNQPIDNSRYSGKLEFKAKVDCILDGFSGYFTAKLYKDIEISILPQTHTQGLLSWYPIFFPVERCYVKKGENIVVEFWRKVAPDKVWYEWKSQDGIIANEGGLNHPILM